jgi:3-keto-5-aminohexanoate cleavage enzyme
MAAVLLGGHLRVGMEDNLYVERGVLAENNAQLVEKALRLLKELGESPASPAEASAILGVSTS